LESGSRRGTTLGHETTIATVGQTPLSRLGGRAAKRFGERGWQRRQGGGLAGGEFSERSWMLQGVRDG
jgi:hypothetical protein